MRNPVLLRATQLCVLVALLLISERIFSQDFNPEADRYQKLADSLGEAKQYKAAARNYFAESETRRMVAYKRQPAVNATYFYAMADMPDSALVILQKAVKYGFRNRNWMDSEPGLAAVRKNKAYAELTKFIADEEKAQQNPDQAAVITSDIALFWKVYDQYKKDPSNAQQLFLKEYFEKGTPDLQEYFKTKTPNIGGVKGFVHNLETMPDYYASIRANTEQVSSLEDSLRIIFRNMKQWYQPATFPNVAFVIGRWSSGGTVGRGSGKQNTEIKRETQMSSMLRPALVVAALLIASGPALAADDLASCTKGITFIKAEIAKNPPAPVLTRLKKALKDANRELGEGEFDECMDAVRDAEKATGRKS